MWTGEGVQRGTTNQCPRLENASGWAFMWRLLEAALLRQVEVEVRRRRQKRGPFMEAGKEVCEGYSRRNKRALCSHMVREGRGWAWHPAMRRKKDDTLWSFYAGVSSSGQEVSKIQIFLQIVTSTVMNFLMFGDFEKETATTSCYVLESQWIMVACVHKPLPPSSLLIYLQAWALPLIQTARRANWLVHTRLS